MRKLILGCALLAAAVILLALSPSVEVRARASSSGPSKSSVAQAPAPGPASASRRIDPEKEADIRKLMDITGTNSIGPQLAKAGIEQLRASVMESQPDNPVGKQFVDAFAVQFQKHFDARSLTESVVPIYDKYLSAEDVKTLIEYYKTPFGQHMLKVLPDLARESQSAGYAFAQRAARQSMEDLRADYPEFVPDSNEDPKSPAPGRKDN